MKTLRYALVALSLLGISCKKDLENAPPPPSSAKLINGSPEADAMLPFRWISPYSVKTLRTLRTAIASHPDEKVQSNLNTTLKPANYQLYYKIAPTTTTQTAAFNAWLDADTLHTAFSYPIDSLSLYPHLFTPEVLEAYEDQKEVFFTTVPLNQPLPSGIGASVLDTLYVPDQTETVLRFYAKFG